MNWNELSDLLKAEGNVVVLTFSTACLFALLFACLFVWYVLSHSGIHCHLPYILQEFYSPALIPASLPPPLIMPSSQFLRGNRNINRTIKGGGIYHPRNMNRKAL